MKQTTQVGGRRLRGWGVILRLAGRRFGGGLVRLPGCRFGGRLGWRFGGCRLRRPLVQNSTEVIGIDAHVVQGAAWRWLDARRTPSAYIGGPVALVHGSVRALADTHGDAAAAVQDLERLATFEEATVFEALRRDASGACACLVLRRGGSRNSEPGSSKKGDRDRDEQKGRYLNVPKTSVGM